MSNELSVRAAVTAAPPPPAAPVQPTNNVAVKPVDSAEHPSVAADKKFQPTINFEEQQRATREAIAKLNEHMAKTSSDLNFSVDDVVNTTVITVKRKSTGEVVRQIPNEVVIRVAHDIENLKGVLYSEKI